MSTMAALAPRVKLVGCTLGLACMHRKGYGWVGRTAQATPQQHVLAMVLALASVHACMAALCSMFMVRRTAQAALSSMCLQWCSHWPLFTHAWRHCVACSW